MRSPIATIEQTGQAIIEGQIVAYPTEAIWGLGCDPFNEQAVMQLLQLKNRPVEKGLILVAASIAQVLPLLAAGLEDNQLVQLVSQTEKPVTWLVPFKPDVVPKWITGEHSRLAIRISEHPLVKALCQYTNGPIISTSANPTGSPAATHISQIRQYFGAALIICEGKIGTSTQPSMIKDLLTAAVIRA